MSRSKSFLASFILAFGLPALAVADNYKIDPDHTYPSLEVPHMGISTFRGKFTKTTGKSPSTAPRRPVRWRSRSMRPAWISDTTS